MDISQKVLHIVASVLTIVVYLDAVTVNPSLCPTNKIAPHRRAVSLKDESQPRTLRLIFGLVTPSRPRPYYSNDLNNLQEQPDQEENPDDCGDIEDYDETDLSSITRPAQNYVYNKKRDHRQLFDGSYNMPTYNPDIKWHHRPGQRPERPQRPQRPTFYPPNRPPFSSGGTYGFNVHRPPLYNNPSTPVKPVNEDTHEDPQDAYIPGLVGGVFGQVVGFSTVKPTVPSDRVTSQKNTNTLFRFPSDSYNNNRRARAKPNVASNIIGSFVDLLFN